MTRFAWCRALLILIVVLPHAPLRADAFVEAEIWAEFEPVVADGTERPLPREIVLERLLDEVRYTVSGLVYGYRFDYVPGDPARDMDESFELLPYATIARGDPALTVFQTWVDGDRLVARVIYELDADQTRWYTGWQSGANHRSTGVGVSSLFEGPDRKFTAVSDGIRDAVREHVRAQEFTRPLRITGAAILAASPRYAIVRGNYQVSVDVLLQIDRIERFTTF